MSKNKIKFKDFNDAFKERNAAKKVEYDSKYDNGEPVEIEIKVSLGYSYEMGEERFEKRKFTIDNKLDIRKKLNNIVFIDMNKVEQDKTKHSAIPSYAIKTTSIQKIGSIPEYLHDLPKRTKRKTGFKPEDLRLEAYVKE